MQIFFFHAAAGLSLLWAFVHLIMGGREVARPLLVADLPPVVIYTSYLCWHYVTGALFLLAVLFLLAGFGYGTGLSATLLAGVFVGVGVVIPVATGQGFKLLPQGLLFVPNTALGIAGLLA